MKNWFAIILFCSSMALLSGQQAEDKTAPMPQGPPVQLRAPEFAQWVIKLTINPIQSTSSTAPAGPGHGGTAKPINVLPVTMTKTGKIIERLRSDDQGRAWTAWCIDDLQVTVYPDGKNLVVQPRPSYIGGENSLYEDYSQTDFPRLAWVSLKNYAGIKNYEGKSCLYFKGRYKFPGNDEESDVEAYTDLKTRLPVVSIVSVPSNQYIYTYDFQQPPTTGLVLPSNVQAALDAWRGARSATRKL